MSLYFAVHYNAEHAEHYNYIFISPYLKSLHIISSIFIFTQSLPRFSLVRAYISIYLHV